MLFDTLLVTLIGRLFCRFRPKLIGTLSGKLSGMLSPEVSGELRGTFPAEFIGTLFVLPLATLRRTLDFAQLRPILEPQWARVRRRRSLSWLSGSPGTARSSSPLTTKKNNSSMTLTADGLRLTAPRQDDERHQQV
jgi:hypothetical protein